MKNEGYSKTDHVLFISLKSSANSELLSLVVGYDKAVTALILVHRSLFNPVLKDPSSGAIVLACTFHLPDSVLKLSDL
jgi:hypothetical protein